MEDFIPITRVVEFPNIIAVSPALGIDTLPELIELADQRTAADDLLSHSSGGIGTTSHLGPLLLADNAETEFLHVPYQGASPAATAVVSREVDMVFGNLSVVLPFIQSGDLIALATTSSERDPSLPDVPTVAELGYEDAQMSAWVALFAPTGTPEPIVERLGDAVREAVRTDALVQGFSADGTPIVVDESSHEARVYIQGEIDRWRDFIASAGIEVQ